MCAPRPNAKRPWSLRDRLDERDIADLITAYRKGAIAASLAATHGVSLKSVKRLLHNAGIHRTPPTRRTKTTLTATRHSRSCPAFTERTAASADACGPSCLPDLSACWGRES